jgi:hypothetical protein
VPFEVGNEVITLTGIVLTDVQPTDSIKLQIVISWEKPIVCDLGELEILLRKDDPSGEVIEWSIETCFNQSKTKLEITRTGGNSIQTYYLAVKSEDSSARITGPYTLKGIVTTGIVDKT